MVVPSHLACSRDHPLYFDTRVVHEWYGQLAEAAHTPGLAQHLVRHMGELLPRFAAYYQKLKSLPRRVRRALARCRGISLAGVALLLALCGGPIYGATITVNETTCRLADAIVAANTDTATGGCPAGSGEDLIVLDADVTLGAALPGLTSAMTIQAGLGSIIDGAGNACLHVSKSTGDVILDGLTVENCVATYGGGGVYNSGTLTIANCTISGNTVTLAYLLGGGGVCNAYGTLTIANSTISGNSVAQSSCCWGGGGVSNFGTLTITDSTISGNTAGVGGGLRNYDATATLTNCVISGNTAATGGGLLIGSYYGGDTLDIRTSTISGNTATSGGGIGTYQRAIVLLTQSTLSGNTATVYGGAVHINGQRCNPHDLTLINSTISGNAAGQEGGGIFTQGCPTITLEHTLVSGNTAPTAPEMSLSTYYSVYVDNFNLVGYDGDARSEGFTPGATDIVPAPGVMVADLLAPLADNGGPTQTHALVPGSPAVDAIPTSDPNCLGTTDQRGFPRPVGVGCDIGSFELGSRLPFGGSVTGFIPRQVTCQDRTTGQRLRAKPGDADWDCEALGLSVQPGDEVQTSARGVAEANEVPVGGAVTGMTPRAVFCQNLTTGSKVQAPTSAAEWDCEAMGLVVEPGDRVVTGALGTVDSPPVAERR